MCCVELSLKFIINMNYIIKSHKLEVVSLIDFCELVQTVDFNDSIPHAHAYTLMF